MTVVSGGRLCHGRRQAQAIIGRSKRGAMTRTDRRGSPVLDGVKIAVAPARGAVSSPTRSAHHGGLAQTPPPRRISSPGHSWALAKWTPLDMLEERRGSNGRRPKASQHLRAISLGHAEERCNVDSQVNQVVCKSRTAGSAARVIAARSPLLRRNNSTSTIPDSNSSDDIDRASSTIAASVPRPLATQGRAMMTRTVPSTMPSS